MSVNQKLNHTTRESSPALCTAQPNATATKKLVLYSNTSGNSEEPCAEGYLGSVCGTCNPTSHVLDAALECIPCEGGSNPAALVALYFVLTLAAVVMVAAVALRGAVQEQVDTSDAGRSDG